VGRAADALSRHVFEPDTELLNLGKLPLAAKLDRETLAWILSVTAQRNVPAIKRLRMIREKIRQTTGEGK